MVGRITWVPESSIPGGLAFVMSDAALDVAPVAVVIPIYASTPLLVVEFSAVFLPRELERATAWVGRLALQRSSAASHS